MSKSIVKLIIGGVVAVGLEVLGKLAIDDLTEQIKSHKKSLECDEEVVVEEA